MTETRNIGGYEVLERLEGHGADLYQGRKDGQSFLLAFYDLRKAEADQLAAEVGRTAELSHPAMVRAVEVVENLDSWIVVFERIDGLTLHELMREPPGERMSDMAAMHVAHALFSALDAAHSASGSDGKIAPLVHARVGGHQLFLGWDGTVKLLGFGLSVLYRLSTALDAAGDEWTYAAPEVKSGGAFTVRANLYSAALLSWSLLTGKRPPDDGAPAPLSELRPDLPSSVVQLIDLALHPKLLQRRVSAKQIALALTPHVADGADQLKWFLEPLRAIADFDDTLLLRASLPPKSNLSQVPLAALPPMISLVPDSIAFMDAVVDEDDDDDDDRALTIPAPPKR